MKKEDFKAIDNYLENEIIDREMTLRESIIELIQFYTESTHFGSDDLNIEKLKELSDNLHDEVNAFMTTDFIHVYFHEVNGYKTPNKKGK